MCGIVGLYNFAADDDALAAMLEAIAHRGPDAEGICEIHSHGGDVRLGHRRLSIIDLSDEANQPFEKDGLVLVYNGEVYNYQALKQELEAAGASFRTTSDTEVVLEAWRRWGVHSLNRLRGMFAFALLDRSTGRLILARDPFGIKPLFIARRKKGLAFASELKGLVVALGDALEVDPTALISSLMYYWIPESHCVYRGIEKLPPGHWAEMSPDGAYRQACYFDPQREFVRDSYAEIDVRRPPRHHRGFRGRAYGRGRARLGVPERGSRFQPDRRHRRAPGPCHRGLYDLLSRGRPEARGDARRPLLCAQDRQRLRHQAARDRNRAGRGGHAAARRGDARRADRRRRRDQRVSHLQGGAGGRGQGPPVRHGRRRAVRRVP